MTNLKCDRALRIQGKTARQATLERLCAWTSVSAVSNHPPRTPRATRQQPTPSGHPENTQIQAKIISISPKKKRRRSSPPPPCMIGSGGRSKFPSLSPSQSEGNVYGTGITPLVTSPQSYEAFESNLTLSNPGMGYSSIYTSLRATLGDGAIRCLSCEQPCVFKRGNLRRLSRRF